MKISDLDTVRLLADPLKLDLLRVFAEQEATTKEVAKSLGENITKLYRHVDALLDAGLLEVVSEQQKRGTIERTFRAVATRFEIDHSLFMEDDADASSKAIRDMLHVAETEIMESLERAADERFADEEKQVLLRMRIKASPERMKKLRSLLTDWLAEAEDKDDDGSATEELEEAGVLIAFYPIESK